MPWRIVLLAVLPGCASGYLVHKDCFASGEEWSESYEYREGTLRRSDDGWTVELSAGRYRGEGRPAPPILVLGVRVHLPSRIEEGGEYAIAAPDEHATGECVVELGHVYWFSCTWLPVGPGTVRVTRWNPARGRIAASFEVHAPCAAEGGAVLRHYAGTFAATR